MVAAPNSSGTNRLIQRAARGPDPQAVGDLFARYRERLRKMVRLRLDWRLRGRVSSTSVLDQVQADVGRRLGDYAAGQPFFLWLREVAGRRIEAIHREHLADRPDDAAPEIRLYRGSLPEVTAASMAAQLLGDRGANQSAVRADWLRQLQGALDALDPVDREVLALRHFEELTGDEAAAVLGLSRAALTVRYLQAAKRLNEVLASIPGFLPARS